MDAEFLRTIEQKADAYLIYADECGLGEDFLQRNKITFKKIPRDIKKLWIEEGVNYNGRRTKSSH